MAKRFITMILIYCNKGVLNGQVDFCNHIGIFTRSGFYVGEGGI